MATEQLLRSDTIQVATGIVPLGVFAPTEVAAVHRELARRFPGRFVLGLGGPQQPRSLAALEDQLTGPAALRAAGLLATASLAGISQPGNESGQ